MSGSMAAEKTWEDLGFHQPKPQSGMGEYGVSPRDMAMFDALFVYPSVIDIAQASGLLDKLKSYQARQSGPRVKDRSHTTREAA